MDMPCIPLRFLQCFRLRYVRTLLVKKSLQGCQVSTAITVIEVPCPSPYYLVEILNDCLFGYDKGFSAGQSFYLTLDVLYGFL